MREYSVNKRPKIPELLKTIRATLTRDRKNSGFCEVEQANELGYGKDIIDAYLKPSRDEDMGLHTWLHILETSGDLSSLEYINSMFDGVFVPHQVQKAKATNINILCDLNMMESNEAFNATKKALRDGVVSSDEKKEMIKELEDQIKSATSQLEAVKNIEVVDD